MYFRGVLNGDGLTIVYFRGLSNGYGLTIVYFRGVLNGMDRPLCTLGRY